MMAGRFISDPGSYLGRLAMSGDIRHHRLDSEPWGKVLASLAGSEWHDCGEWPNPEHVQGSGLYNCVTIVGRPSGRETQTTTGERTEINILTGQVED